MAHYSAKNSDYFLTHYSAKTQIIFDTLQGKNPEFFLAQCSAETPVILGTLQCQKLTVRRGMPPCLQCSSIFLALGKGIWEGIFYVHKYFPIYSFLSRKRWGGGGGVANLYQCVPTLQKYFPPCEGARKLAIAQKTGNLVSQIYKDLGPVVT